MCGVSSLLFYAGVIVYSNYKNTKIISNEAKKEIFNGSVENFEINNMNGIQLVLKK